MNRITDKLLDYFPSAAFLAILHLAIPPLTYFGISGNENPPEQFAQLLKAWYAILPSVCKDPKYVMQLVLRDEDRGNLFNHTTLTHMFVHGSYQHLFSNLTASLLLGYDVFSAFGDQYLYSLFLSGGIFATLPIDRYYTTFLEYYHKQWQPKKQVSASLFGWVDNLTNTWTKTFDSFFKDVFKPIEVHVGSSGGIFALLGARTVVSTKILMRNITTLYSLHNHTTTMRHHTRPEDILMIFASIAYQGYSLYNVAQLLHQELLSNQDQQVEAQSFLRFLYSNRTPIDHTGHMQGFGFGFIVTMGYSLLSGKG